MAIEGMAIYQSGTKNLCSHKMEINVPYIRCCHLMSIFLYFYNGKDGGMNIGKMLAWEGI